MIHSAAPSTTQSRRLGPPGAGAVRPSVTLGFLPWGSPDCGHLRGPHGPHDPPRQGRGTVHSPFDSSLEVRLLAGGPSPGRPHGVTSGACSVGPPTSSGPPFSMTSCRPWLPLLPARALESHSGQGRRVEPWGPPLSCPSEQGLCGTGDTEQRTRFSWEPEWQWRGRGSGLSHRTSQPPPAPGSTPSPEAPSQGQAMPTVGSGAGTRLVGAWKG